MGTPAPDSNVLGIDILVAMMVAVASLHAVQHRQLSLFVASCLLGCGTEFMAIRFGGTHCHNAGIINFAQCSSVNSVVYYGPWIYSSVASALKLVGDGSRWPLPWLCGAFAFGMCGIYEMQGPNMRWWRWPDPATGHLVDFAGEPFWQLKPTGDSMVITPHAGAALKERVWALSDPTWPRALPVMAPYFDMAFGWGVGLVLWVAPSLGTVVCVLLGPLAALLWDLPVRLLEEQFGVDKTESVPMLMATAVILPLLLMRGGLRRQPSTTQPDWLLFSVPGANAAFFAHNAVVTSPSVVPPSLKLLVLGVATLSTLAHAMATGVIGTELVASASASGKPKRARSASPAATSPPAAATTRSFLDRLQKDAHSNELEPGNTSPAFFFALSTAQTAVVTALCQYALPERFGTAAALSLASHWAGFLMSVVIGSCRWFDVTEDIAYLGIFIWAHRSIEGEPSQRQNLVFLLAGLWISRLLAFLAYRVIVRGRDFRFDKLITEPSYNLFGWTSGGTWCFVNGFCLWYLVSMPAHAAAAPLDWLDFCGGVVFCLGFGTEIVADLQKYQFNSGSDSGQHEKWICSGLWSVSRHPNYCGEIALWFGLSLMCMGGAKATFAAGGVRAVLCLVTPIWSFFFLVFTSLMLLEKHGDKKWGHIKAYQAYKKSTPVLFPCLS